jgi:hypothetical protein
LLVRGIARELRNAEAHEQAVVNSNGRIEIPDAVTGSLHILDPRELEQQYRTLRAALTGFDAGKACTQIWTYAPLPNTRVSIAAMQFMAALAVYDYARGHVHDCEVRDMALRVEVSGSGRDGLAHAAAHLSALVGSDVTAIEFLDRASGMRILRVEIPPGTAARRAPFFV